MEVLTRAFAQLTDLVRAMTPRARLLAAALLCAVLASVGYLAQREFSGDQVYLLGGQVFTAEEMTSMQGALGKAKLSDFTIDGGRICVPRSRQAVYLAALADGNALPQTLTEIFSEANEKTSWYTSREQQTRNALTANKKGLALILRSMNGVESAEVFFDKQEPRGLRQDQTATALIALKLRGGQSLDADRAACFQRMAAAALTMAPQDVTVVDKTTHALFGGRGTSSSGSVLDDPYRETKRKYQADYEQSVRKALAFIPGVTVSADVELAKELRREERRLEFDAQSSIAVRHNKETTSKIDEGIDARTRPIIVMQGSANQPANISAAQMGPRTTEETSVVSEDVAPAHNQTTTEIAGLTPKRVAISIGIPSSWFVAVWQQRHPAVVGVPSAEPSATQLAEVEAAEIERIRQHVAGAILSSDPALDAKQLVTVTPFADVATPEAAQPSWGAIAKESLANYGAKVGLVFVAIIGLWTLRGLLRTPTAIADPVQASPLRDTVAPRSVRVDPSRGSPERSLREELADVVRDDPAAAANILRSWIGNTN